MREAKTTSSAVRNPQSPISHLPGRALKQAYSADLLTEWLRDARTRSLQLVADLDDEQLWGPVLPITNPFLWEMGHLAWFTEKWLLRRHGAEPLRPDADALYDSSVVPHLSRWDLPLPTRADTLLYMEAVHDRVLARLDEDAPGLEDTYFSLLAIFHEDMHGEAFAYTRQTLSYPAPNLGERREISPPVREHDNGSLPGDIAIPGGRFLLGALPGEPFVFDNEKWAHPVDVQPFALARAPVTQSAFADFVEADGYSRRELWSEAGWRWRESVDARHPVYWQREGQSWYRRHFDRIVPLELELPVIHVCWYEAEAFCRWAGRRLPTEVEWEVAAAGSPNALAVSKRRYPWGDTLPSAHQANLDGKAGTCLAVADLPEGDSAWGCRQMLGNVWEWTASDLVPYPGFVVDPYQEYSRPWFNTHKVLRGGCWLTRGRLLRNTWRNFYLPTRRDIWAGFRTCPIDA
jgi:iron(II)-dependent oxidoreductase